MKKEVIRHIFLFLFSVFFVFLLASFSVFESNNGMGPTFISGSLTQGEPLNIFYFTSHFLLGEAYMFLYALGWGIPWYEIILFFYVAVSLFVILELLRVYTASDPKKWIFPLLLSLVLCTEWVLFMEYTRMAFALGTASTLLLMRTEQDQNRATWISVVLYLFCILTRPEAGVFVLLIQWLVFWFVADKPMSKKVLAFNTLFAILVMGAIAYDRLTTTDIVKQFEPELGYQLLDRENIVPLGTMTNAVDSAKYIATINMITDPEYTSIDFLRSLVGADPYVGIDRSLLRRCAEIMYESLESALGLFIIYFGILLLAMRQRLALGRKTAVKFLLFTAAFWGILVVTVYVIKMERWVFCSVLVMMSFILMAKIDYTAIRRTFVVSGLSGILVLYGAVKLFGAQREHATLLKNDIAANDQFYEKVKEKYAGKIIMPGLSQSHKMINHISPFQMPDFSAFTRVYLFDSDVLYLEPHYNAYLSEECHCHAGSYTNFMDFLVSKKENLVVISDQERTDVMAYYCRVVREKTYTFIPVDSIVTDKHKATVYKLE